ncbi:substrate-binding domain-containing protein [Labrys wisconsinensis]|uniref:Simple sugar transport system substrate-binding protein n=1 Tax=Labrys wisconsinensis TaxID=425677 RepID=A0ABU0J2X0_9HYPH|nr:substrate-binding domain-containing protein [Labrys wisconsinensis]MDQ0468574.1 simple sugar transport system substrate-binding protein [Labrys wisconsinensis]
MRKWLAAALGVCGLLFGQAAMAAERIVFVGHWSESDSFFNVIRNSAQLAADQLGVSIEFRNPAGGDLSEMGRLIDQAIASKPAGIISTVPDEAIVGGSLGNAVASGIPVVIVNSGSAEIARKIGALRYIGQAEYEAGKAAGEKARAADVKSFVCVNHFFQHPASHQRCRGFADGLGVEIGDQEIDSGSDPNDVVARTAAFLKAHPGTQAILTLGPTGADPMIKWVKEQGGAEKYYFATFDLSQDIAGAMKEGMIKVAVDQQPFIQGYGAVETLTNYVRFGVLQANDVFSGPGLITKDNLDQVLALAGKYR